MIAGHLLMVLIGFWGGFIHIGVGFLLMPTLNRVMQLDLITTNAHKVFVVMCYTVAALLVFNAELEPNLEIWYRFGNRHLDRRLDCCKYADQTRHRTD